MCSSDLILEGRDLTAIYETELASQWLAAADRSHLAQTGEILPTCSEPELAMRAQRALADWDRLLRHGHAELITYRFNLCYACVLKLALLHLEEPGAELASAKTDRTALASLLTDMAGRLTAPDKAHDKKNGARS